MGTFRGYFTDFSVKGEIHSSVGDVATDITYKQLGTNNAGYAGILTSPDLDLGKLIGNKTIGTTSFDLQLAGSGLDAQSLNSSISGQIGHISYADYDYKNIVLDGKVALGFNHLATNIKRAQCRIHCRSRWMGRSEEIKTIKRSYNYI